MEGMSTSYMSSYRMVLHSAIRYGFFKPPEFYILCPGGSLFFY